MLNILYIEFTEKLIRSELFLALPNAVTLDQRQSYPQGHLEISRNIFDYQNLWEGWQWHLLDRERGQGYS